MSVERISLQSWTQSAQMKTPGPAITLRPSSRGFPQNEQLVCVRRATAPA
jgi:hypothetical protein